MTHWVTKPRSKASHFAYLCCALACVFALTGVPTPWAYASTPSDLPEAVVETAAQEAGTHAELMPTAEGVSACVVSAVENAEIPELAEGQTQTDVSDNAQSNIALQGAVAEVHGNTSTQAHAEAAGEMSDENARYAEETEKAPTTLDPALSGLAPYYDARDKGLISPVRLQDPWGACWAFGSLAAMEANLVQQGLAESGVQLSPRHLIYFSGTPVGSSAGTQEGEGQHAIDELIDMYGENAVFELGGHALEVASAISSGEGVVYEADYPYQNNEGEADARNYSSTGTWILPESERYNNTAFTLRNMHRISNPAVYSEEGNVATWALDWNALDAVKQAILDYGAVSASYCSFDGTKGNPDYYNAYNYTFFTNETMVIDHDVCIVGWDDTVPSELFTTGQGSTIPEYDGAWIVKNSWGSPTEDFPNRNDWGKEGYFYLSYCDRSAQGFTAWEMMPIETSITNQYDYMGQRSNAETRVTHYSPEAYANVFVASENQRVEAVSVNTYAPGTEVVIRLYLLDEATATGQLDPTLGTLLEEKTVKVEWGGYHRIQLDNKHYVKKGQRFAVVASMLETNADGTKTYVASVEAGNNSEYVGRLGVSHYDTVVNNKGETRFLATVDELLQWLDGTVFAQLLHEAASDGAWFGNACLKVFANPFTEPEPVPDPKPEPGPSPDPQPAPTPVPERVPDFVPSPEAYGVALGNANSLSQSKAHALAATADTNPAPLFVLVLVISFGVTLKARRNFS